MKFVAQRVLGARLSVDGRLVSEIGRGLVVYLGVAAGDTEAEAERCAAKLAALRIFADGEGKMNRSVLDIGGEVLFVSQFTLCGNCDRGNRPSFTEAARPERAKPLYEYAGHALAERGVPVKWGIFGADMRIEQDNDGPVTILWEVPPSQGDI